MGSDEWTWSSIASFDPTKIDLSKRKWPSSNELQEFLLDSKGTPCVIMVLGTQAAVGGSVFWATLTLSQLLQGMLRVSAASGVMAPLLGVGTVCCGSVAAGFSADIVARVIEDGIEPVFAQPVEFTASPLECAQFSTLGIIAFSLLGGRYSCIAPSDLAKLGAFSHLGRSMSASGEAYATAGSRNAMRIYGTRSLYTNKFVDQYDVFIHLCRRALGLSQLWLQGNPTEIPRRPYAAKCYRGPAERPALAQDARLPQSYSTLFPAM
jgi:hypothetical protein